MTSAVYRSAVLSLTVQVLLGVVTGIGLLIPVPAHAREDLQPIFILELVSQAIEFAWYALVVLRYREIVTWTRYADWFFSTPTMLVSTVLFFLHRSDTDYSVFVPSGRFAMIITLNALMLAFGFAIESDAFPKGAGILLGTVMLAATFRTMATFLPPDDGLSIGLFTTMAVVWALYGVAAALAYAPKNIAYNLLDIVSKNFYGLFLTVYAITL